MTVINGFWLVLFLYMGGLVCVLGLKVLTTR